MFLQSILRFFRRLFGIPDPPIALVDLSPLTFRAPRGTLVQGAVRVQAFSPADGSPLPGERLLVDSLGGEVLIQGSDQEEQLLRTDENGQLALDIVMQSASRALISVSLPDDQERRMTELNAPLLFEGRSEGATDSIAITFPPVVTAGGGPIHGTFAAVDFQEAPVTGGDFVVSVVLSEEDLLEVEPAETRQGNYAFTLDLELAGDFVLVVTDLDSRAEGRQALCVLPGPASAIRLLSTSDPRAREPYDHLRLQARLEDRFGNPLPAGRFEAVDEGGVPFPRRLLNGQQAAFDLRAGGSGQRTITLRDSDSDVSRAVEILFSAAWLRDPGLVQVSGEFSTPIFFAPPTGEMVQAASIQLEFDPQAVALGAFTSRDLGPGVHIESEPGESSLTIQVRSEAGLSADDYPAGLEIGQADWHCLSPQEACFSLTAVMSPPSVAWVLCVQQKKVVEACVCLNIIYYSGHKRTFKKARKLAKNFERIVSSDDNLGDCCPKLKLEIRECPVKPREWRAITKERKGGLPRITLKRDLNTLAQLVEDNVSCRQANCINLVLYPFSDKAAFYGLMKKSGSRQGFGAVDRSNFTIRSNLISHELGHALGLSHETDPKNLMTNPPRSTSRDYKEDLTAAQCQTIIDNLARYPCAE